MPVLKVKPLPKDIDEGGYTKAEIDEMMRGKQNTIDSENKLSADLIDTSGTDNQFVTAQEKEHIDSVLTDVQELKEEAQEQGQDLEEVFNDIENIQGQIDSLKMDGGDITV